MTNKLMLDSHKLLWHRDRVKAWVAGERVAPISMDIALSTQCTYRCVYCYGQLQTLTFQSIPRDSIMRFLDDAAEIGVKSIAIVGDGESTCNPHLYEAILRGKANGLDMALGTNGALLRKDRLEDILPCLTYLRFNISAADPGRYAEIHGCPKHSFEKVIDVIRACVRVKRQRHLPVTIGLQMVLIPGFDDQILPLARLGGELGVDYTVIKHCADDELGSLGIDYSWYLRPELHRVFRKAEAFSRDSYQVAVKWSKILTGNKRTYSQCYGPALQSQISGSGLVAPCGMFFGQRYDRFHIGNIIDKPFKEIWQSDRYWEVMEFIGSEKFDAKKDCGCLCLQEVPNRFLYALKHGEVELTEPTGPPPQHINFL